MNDDKPVRKRSYKGYSGMELMASKEKEKKNVAFHIIQHYLL